MLRALLRIAAAVYIVAFVAIHFAGKAIQSRSQPDQTLVSPSAASGGQHKSPELDLGRGSGSAAARLAYPERNKVEPEPANLSKLLGSPDRHPDLSLPAFRPDSNPDPLAELLASGGKAGAGRVSGAKHGPGMGSPGGGGTGAAGGVTTATGGSAAEGADVRKVDSPRGASDLDFRNLGNNDPALLRTQPGQAPTVHTLKPIELPTQGVQKIEIKTREHSVLKDK